MYRISEQQIEFILNDISARGVETEDLQYNLLDHICCIIESKLEADGDFENFYMQTIATFYKHELREIEEETQLLLTFKNYYTMRKVMLNSGIFAAAILSLGLVFKFMHWPGASMFIVLGLGSASLVFVPLLFTIRVKEKKEKSDKILLALGSLSGFLGITHILFKIMHWPGSLIMAYIVIAILILVFTPIFVITGIKNSETKANTIVTSLIIVMGCGLWLTLVVSPKASKFFVIKNTLSFARNEQLLKNEKQLYSTNFITDSSKNNNSVLASEIFELCQDLKSKIIFGETGVSAIDENFESKNIFLEDNYIVKYFEDEISMKKLENLRNLVNTYNKNVNPSQVQIPLKYTVIDELERLGNSKVYGTLNELTQLQMFVLQNQRLTIATK
jgi:hypothetical protein